jgi:ribosome-binding factor A
MSTHNRPDRVGQLLQQLLGEVFARGMRDPRIGLVTITGVKMSPDLREARIYYAVHGDEKIRKDTQKGLEAAKGFLRREIGKGLGLRLTPDLRFTYDEAIDRGDRIDQLLREAREHDQRLLAETDGGPEKVEPAGETHE